MSSKQELLEDYKGKILKALDHLEYSFGKVKGQVLELPLNEENLETWESFTARFSRVVDLFLTKYLRLKVLLADPAFDGSLRDFCNVGEKIGLLDSADKWMELRGYRNATVHEYEDKDLVKFFEKLRAESDRLLKLRTKLNAPQI